MPVLFNDLTIGPYWKRVLRTEVHEGNKVDHLVDGLDTFQAMYEALLTATTHNHYIYLLGWSLDGDIGLQNNNVQGKPKQNTSDSSIKTIFKKAAGHGVQIRMMLWSNSQYDVNGNKPMVDLVNGYKTGAAILDSRTMHPLVGSHHQKVLIVKGSKGIIGFCGGVDIYPDRIMEVEVRKAPEQYNGQIEAAAKGSPYNDVHCRIEGPSLKKVIDVFVQRWQEHPLSKALDKDKGELLGLPDQKRNISVINPPGQQSVSILRTFNRVSGTFAVVVGTIVGERKVCILEHSIRTAIINLIRAANVFIYLEDQYMISLEIAKEMKNALAHLQHITILTTSSASSDLPLRWKLRSEFIDILMQAKDADKKVRIFYKVTPGTGLDKPEEFGKQTYIHSKAWVFDDQLAIIGSANCNSRGLESDSEVAAAIFDKMNDEDPKKYSFAQKLRIDLWKKHLEISEGKKLSNGKESADLWLDAAKNPKSGIRRYNPKAGSDKGIGGLNREIIDPGSEGYNQCEVK